MGHEHARVRLVVHHQHAEGTQRARGGHLRSRPRDLVRGRLLALPLVALRSHHDAEHRSLADLGVHVQVVSHELAHRSRDREPEAGTAESAGGAAVSLLKGLEDRLQPVLRDPDPGVDHADREGCSVRFRVDARGHGPVLGELERVADQIDNHLLELVRVGLDRAVHVGSLRHQLDVLVAYLTIELLDGLAHQRADVHCHDLELYATGLDLGQVQDLVDQGQQVAPVHHDPVEEAHLLLIEVLLLVLEDDVREADDRIERGAQLVAHVGEKLTFGLVGNFGDFDLFLHICCRFLADTFSHFVERVDQ